MVGGKGTIYDENYFYATYAHIDGGTSNPGYFTAKNAGLRGDVNGDGSVNISDVTALIDFVLGGTWNYTTTNQYKSFMLIAGVRDFLVSGFTR